MILCFYILFSKIIPSFFTIKEGSTFLTKPLFPQKREDVTALSAIYAPPVPPQREGPYPIPKSGARNRYAIGLADQSKVSPGCAGWDRLPIILLKVLDTTPILEPPCLVISHKENVMSLMYKDESSSHHRLTSYPYPRKTYHNDH